MAAAVQTVQAVRKCVANLNLCDTCPAAGPDSVYRLAIEEKTGTANWSKKMGRKNQKWKKKKNRKTRKSRIKFKRKRKVFAKLNRMATHNHSTTAPQPPVYPSALLISATPKQKVPALPLQPNANRTPSTAPIDTGQCFDRLRTIHPHPRGINTHTHTHALILSWDKSATFWFIYFDTLRTLNIFTVHRATRFPSWWGYAVYGEGGNPPRCGGREIKQNDIHQGKWLN